MKKISLMILMFLLFVFVGCGSSDKINVISREASSGTRSAFVEMFEILEDGVDKTTKNAQVTQSTSVVITSVAQNKNSIGYISLGSLNDTVKAVSIDGVEATVANVLSGDYKISRPFNLVYKADLDELSKDFIKFILSKEGRDIINNNNYIKVSKEEENYVSQKLTGKIVLAGSTSVSPVMEKLADAYKKLNAGVEIEIQQSGSSAGITSVSKGICNIGMSSRELKTSELESGLLYKKIAVDGIAVIVNKNNDILNLTSKQVKDIFVGNVTSWAELNK